MIIDYDSLIRPGYSIIFQEGQIMNDIDFGTVQEQDTEEKKDKESVSEKDKVTRAIIIRVVLLMILAIVLFSYMTILGVINIEPYADWLWKMVGTSIG